MNYNKDALNQLTQKHAELLPRYSDLAITVGAFTQSLESKRAREFMVHGVSRRLWLIYRCIVNIFRDLGSSLRLTLVKKSQRSNVDLTLNFDPQF